MCSGSIKAFSRLHEGTIKALFLGSFKRAVGRFDGASVLRTVEEWDAAAGVWRERAGMMHPRRDHAVCVLAGIKPLVIILLNSLLMRPRSVCGRRY